MHEDLARGLGAAAVIFAILAGMGSCSYLGNMGAAELQRARNASSK